MNGHLSKKMKMGQGDAPASGSAEDIPFEGSITLEQIRREQRIFSDERNWAQHHTPRNLMLALVGEVGELSECFMWKKEVEPGLPGWTHQDKVHLGEEMSDVMIYLVRLADQCNIDLPSAVLRKIDLNRQKYPADKVNGSIKKYTQYQEGMGQQEQESLTSIPGDDEVDK